jgi:membrane-associated phospholipid phosphatase
MVDLTALAQLVLAFALVLAAAATGLVLALHLARRPTFAIAGALGATLVAGGTLAGVVVRQIGPTGLIDQPTAAFLAAHRTAWLTGAMRLATDLGAAGVLVPLTLVAGLLWRWRRGSWRPGAVLAGALAGAWVLQVSVKQLVERARPPAGLAVVHAGGFAFPSGHATDAVATYGTLAFLVAHASQRRLPRAAAWAAAAGLVVAVGLSRVYLGVHWLTDVLAGVGLGAVWAGSLILIVGNRIERPAPQGGKLAAQPLPADGPLLFLAPGTGPPVPHRRLGWVLVAVLIILLLVIPELTEDIGQPDRATARAAVAAPAAVGRRPPHAIPRPAAAHVVLVVEENHEFSQVIGARQAPFLNRLAATGTLLTRYDAVTHPSLPNYVAMVAGDPLGIHSDCKTCQRRGPTLVDQLQAAGISWKAYYQGLPAPCSTAVTAGAYAKKVNPFLHLDSVRSAPLRCRRVVPLGQLGDDLRRGRLPRFAMVTPDLVHSMHSGSIAQADAFLHRLDRQLLTSSAGRSGILLIVTFDEGISDHGLYGRRGGGHVATIVVGPGVPAGGRDPTPYDHYALLRSLEQRFGLRPLRHAADRQTRTIPAIAGPPAVQAGRKLA